MASSRGHGSATLPENGDDDDLLCTIEASVVTGFEESARGEAKEKFDTDVTAARGKVIWKVPLSKVKDVLKMGSVDNCKAVIHTVPRFKFTDQHDSLANLQKMVIDIDWELGLKAWQRIYHFPHPIVTQPQGVVSADDLVDVVIISTQPAPKGKSGKKSKNKKGWGKKKDRNKNEEGHNRKKQESCESEPGDEIVKIEEGMRGLNAFNENLPKPPANEIGDGRAEIESESLTSMKEAGLNELSGFLAPTTGSVPTPHIETEGFLSPLGPGEVFVNGAHLEGSLDGCSHLTECLHSVKMQLDHAEDLTASTSKSVGAGNVNPNIDSFVDSTASATSSQISESEFASNVIRRLTSPSEPVSRGAESPNMMCVTPPPTPIRSIDNPFSILQGRLPFLDGASNLPDRSQGGHQDDTSASEGSVDSHLSTCDKTQVRAALSSTLPSLTSPALSTDADRDSVPTAELPSGQSGSTRQATVECLPEEEQRTSDGTVPVKKVRDPTKPTFRVTCNRTGDMHAFDSSSAAASFGSAIITYLGWQVDLKNFDIEVILNIDNEEVTVSLALTKMSLHYRNLVAFGPTTLRATICYNMLRLCRIKNGDFVCDPMCGTSAIPIEGARSWANCYHIGGDVHDKAIEKSILNVAAIQQQMRDSNKNSLKLDTIQWDIQRLPLRDKCVDVFVSDLPFGHRIGSRSDNLALYSSLLSEMARTGRTGARACLLTEDKFSLIKAVQALGKYWQRRLILNINIGGLSGFVFLLTRTTSAVIQSWTGWQDGTGESVSAESSTLAQHAEDTTE